MPNLDLLRKVREAVRNPHNPFTMMNWVFCIGGYVARHGADCDAHDLELWKRYHGISANPVSIEEVRQAMLEAMQRLFQDHPRLFCSALLGITNDQGAELFEDNLWRSPQQAGETRREAAVRNIDLLIADLEASSQPVPKVEPEEELVGV